jgi:hypothetical protein
MGFNMMYSLCYFRVFFFIDFLIALIDLFVASEPRVFVGSYDYCPFGLNIHDFDWGASNAFPSGSTNAFAG